MRILHHTIKAIIIIRVLALVTILIGLMDKGLTFFGWMESSWNFVSYNRWLPIVGLIGATVYSLYIYFRYGHPMENIVIWIPALSWFVLELILLYGIWVGI